MRRSPLRWMAVVGFAALSLGADYRGCGASPGASDADEDVALPVATGCLSDGDCEGVDACSQVRCLAGECVVTGLAVDRDGDGHAPVPCGMDCDDSSPDRYPDAPESCDGVDQDCDSRIDEEAIGVSGLAVLGDLEESTLVAAGDELWIVGDTLEGGLAVHPLDESGPGPIESLAVEVGLPRGAVGFADGRIVVVGPAETARFTIYELERGSAGYEVTGQEEVGEPAELRDLHVRRVGTELFVVYDAQSESGPERGLLHPVAGAVLLEADPEGAPPSLAFDGSRLAVTSGARGVQLLSASGEPVALRELPGDFAYGALTDGDRDVIAAYRDAFDHALTRVAPEGRNASVLAPAGDSTDALSVHRIEQGVLVLRRQEVGLSGWVLSEDLATYRATLSPDQLTSFIPESPIRAVNVATRSDGITAVHTQRFDAGDSVSFLTCEVP